MSMLRNFLERFQSESTTRQQVVDQETIYDASQFAAGNIESPEEFDSLSKKIAGLLNDLEKNPYTRKKAKKIRSILVSIRVEVPPRPKLEAGWIERIRAGLSGTELPQYAEYKRELDRRSSKLGDLQKQYSRALILLEEARVLGSLLSKNQDSIAMPVLTFVEPNKIRFQVPFVRIETIEISEVIHREQQYIPVVSDTEAIGIVGRLNSLRNILFSRDLGNSTGTTDEEMITKVVPRVYIEIEDYSERIGDAGLRIIHRGPEILDVEGNIVIRSHQELLKINLNYSTPGILRYTIQSVGGGEIEQMTMGEDMDSKLFSESISQSLVKRTGGLLAINPEVIEESLDLARKHAQGDRLIKELTILYEKFEENRDIKQGFGTEAGRLALIENIKAVMPWLAGTQILEDIETICSLGIIQTASQWSFFLKAMQVNDTSGLETLMERAVNPIQRQLSSENSDITALTLSRPTASVDQVKDFMSSLIARTAGGYSGQEESITIGVVTRELLALGVVPSSSRVGDPLTMNALKALLNKQSLREIFRPENIKFFENYVEEMQKIRTKIAKQTRKDQLLIAGAYEEATALAGKELAAQRPLIIDRMRSVIRDQHNRITGIAGSIAEEVIDGEFTD